MDAVVEIVEESTTALTLDGTAVGFHWPMSNYRSAAWPALCLGLRWLSYPRERVVVNSQVRVVDFALRWPDVSCSEDGHGLWPLVANSPAEGAAMGDTVAAIAPRGILPIPRIDLPAVCPEGNYFAGGIVVYAGVTGILHVPC